MLPTWYKNVRTIYLAKETRCDGIIGIHNTNQVVYNGPQKKQRTLLLHIASYCHPLVLDVLVIEASTRISKSPVTFTLFTSEASILLPDMLSASLATPGKGRE